MGLELLIILLLVLLNGLFVMAEMALVTARRAKLQAMARKLPGAQTALDLLNDPGRFLSTVQVGITLLGVLASAVGGATLAQSIAGALADVTVLAPYADAAGIGIVVVGITVTTLVLGELVPKRIALGNAERISAALSPMMSRLSRLMGPVVAALGWMSSGVIRLLGFGAETVARVSEEEIRQLVREGADTGVILAVERELVDRVFRLGDKLADDIMTPRPQMITLDAEAPVEANLKIIRETGFSRYPVQRGEEWIGILRAKDLVFQIGSPSVTDLFAKIRGPLFVPETTPALSLLDQFKEATVHMALVVDEYGDVKGLLTQTDILAAIVGEIAAQRTNEPSSVLRRADGTLLVDALLPADELRDHLNVNELPGEEEHDFNTVAGLMLAQFEHIPREGESFDWRGFRFEVVDMDGRRIDKILITPLPAGPADGSSGE